MVRVVSVATFLAVVLGLGCRSSTGPYAEIVTRLEIDQTRIAVGEPLTLRAIATNHGERTVELLDGPGCGPGMSFEVRFPSGVRELLPSGEVPSTCELLDGHILEPGETDTLALAWAVPGPPGTYRVWAGVRARSGIAARSTPLDITVE